MQLSAWVILFLLSVLPGVSATPIPALEQQQQPVDSGHSRQKRLLWLTSDRRLVMPPGTSLIVTPSLAMPFIRNPPPGLHSNLTISFPFTVDFDSLGVSDNQNPFGTFPFANQLKGRSLGRQKRDLNSEDAVGGERAFLYPIVEDFLSTLGMDGKSCFLRAICEMHEFPLYNHGFLGEVLELFLTVSRSPFADSHLSEYLAAEQAGREDQCWNYQAKCPKSLFEWRERNKYTKEAAEEHNVMEEFMGNYHWQEDRL